MEEKIFQKYLREEQNNLENLEIKKKYALLAKKFIESCTLLSDLLILSYDIDTCLAKESQNKARDFLKKEGFI